ncbi:SGNH/GDSL hydrolase family protein [Isoptericola sp. b441]|uniref:SGNH/GDSL hydrolase family protein n=1 Tax=Actinotalea lenta TaxID=3064654 RepID=A0ABT9DCJ8_9CELL|nr:MULTISPECIES: SGNH/GDSL hydrolase family protein [unclassified Isoptericola]MDO8106647.1 SGNH/GDSL hydrolase family protein [Isoptericola sp. b441]MDO8121645.1 SGNH/GDSL hydrolase family protein [Isoptericola sp. b490]
MTWQVGFTRTHHPDAAHPWRRYVALGDSFTEGLWDVPGGHPPRRTSTVDPTLPVRGWADLLADHLADRARPDGEPVRYANLAIRGRLMRPIVDEQLPVALGLEPDLVSIIGGGNDLLRPSGDPDDLAALLEDAVARARAVGADVLLATGMDTRYSPVVRRTRPRTGIFNAHIWSIARRHGAHVLDVWGMRSLMDWRMWAPDRIHLTSEGHRRVAQGALVALGLEPDDERWDDPLAPLPEPPAVQRWRTDAAWLRDHAYPWATRRLRQTSSGDTRHAKRPELVTVVRDD